MASFCVTLFDSIENPAENDACFICATRNFTISRGSSYKIIYLLSKDGSNVNLNGYSLRGSIKASSTSSDVLLSLSSSNLLLEINNTNSQIFMYLKENFTRRIQSSSVVYDIEIINSIGDTSKIVTGLITII
jgi:hypothetical protein